MYTGLALDKSMRATGMKSTFRATGQTGILITGDGVPPDAVVADFMAGSIEWLTPDNDADHWDVIEGQGSLYHVSFSGVTLALIHGGQPDALILCHEPTRTHMRGLPGYDLPPLEALRDLALPLARVATPDCVVAGISINTQHMGQPAAVAYPQELADRMHSRRRSVPARGGPLGRGFGSALTITSYAPLAMWLWHIWKKKKQGMCT